MAVSSLAQAAQAAVGSGTQNLWDQLDQKKVAGIGGSIPGAGIYMQQQAQAELAYNNAKAQLEANKNRSFQKFGLTAQGAVDPMSEFGDYQALLHKHAVDLAGADEHSVQRGLGAGAGLGMQEESDLRYNQALEDLGFQQQLADTESAYTQGAQGALQTRNAGFLDAQMQALANAIATGAFTPAGAEGSYANYSNGGTNMSDFRYGATLPQGYSDESILAAAKASAPYNGQSVPMHIMNQGMVKDGKISIKFKNPDGTTTTEWIPLPILTQQQTQPQTTTNTRAQQIAAALNRPRTTTTTKRRSV